MAQVRARTLGIVAALAVLPGCLTTGQGGAGLDVSRFLGGSGRSDVAAMPMSAMTPPAAPAVLNAVPEAGGSAVITQLLSRRTVLTEDGAYARIAASVMAADARVAAAELQAAQLRAQAANKNWLPSFGPRISLSSLGDFVADLLVEQVLFDNGRKKAERDLARADVELAAVALSEDGNARVHDGLRLYLDAEEARESAALNRQTLKDMEHFEWVMSERVRGGVSDMSDLNVIRQKLTEIRARIGAAEERRVTALAELRAMTAGDLAVEDGIEPLAPVPPGAVALTVLRAEVEKDRTMAEARIERASHLPGLSAGGSTGDSGDNLGLSVTTDKLFGLGTGASLKAARLTEETADRRVAQAREDSLRKLSALTEQRASLERQAEEARGITEQAKANLDLFQRQYKAGQRQVTDVVGVYETFAKEQARGIELKYKRARTAVQIAREKGVLVSGDSL